MHQEQHKRSAFTAFLLAIGVVFGNIASSPLFVMKTIVRYNGGLPAVTEEFVLGALSLIIWTLTILATLKYIFLVMKADNGGEGGIFALYFMVRQDRRTRKVLRIAAIVGAGMLLADSIITPSITVTSAVEGLHTAQATDRLLGEGDVKKILFILLIVVLLYISQGVGRNRITVALGPIVFVWLLFIGGTGTALLLRHPEVLRAFDPVLGVKLLTSNLNNAGIKLMGSVFLVVTGAEAFYSDMGHAGRDASRASWPFVKICLLLSYLGQGAYLLDAAKDPSLAAVEDFNPFFYMLPERLRPLAVILAVLVAFAVSHTVVVSAFTMVSQAIRREVLPHMETLYSPRHEGSVFIPAVNRLLFVGCVFVVLFFRSSTRMEAAYGLAIAVAMLMTTVLLSVYLWKTKKKPVLSVLCTVLFGAVELICIKGSSHKFTEGGYISEGLALLLIILMMVWKYGCVLESRLTKRVPIADYIGKLQALKADDSIPLTADNIVYVCYGDDFDYADHAVLYSILDKDVKRAQAWWFIKVNVLDVPNGQSYRVETFGTDCVFRVMLYLGFNEEQSINLYLRKIVEELMDSGEMPKQRRKFSVYDNDRVGDFRFVFIKKKMPMKSGLPAWQDVILRSKYAIRSLAGKDEQWYGLDTAVLIHETVPLFISPRRMDGVELTRIRTGEPEK